MTMNRRNFFGITAGAGASLALTPELVSALQRAGGLSPDAASLLQRAIPSTGEKLPVISYGPRPTDGAAMKEVLRTLAANGGRMVDVLHGGPAAEEGARAAARELGMQDKFFWTTPLSVSVPVLPGYNGPPIKITPAMVRAAMEERFATLKVNKIDLVMVGAYGDPSTQIAVLQEMKKEGRVRYIGVHDLATPPYPPDAAFARLEALMRNEPIDFVGTDYQVGWRGVEEKILPLALERKIAFMAYFPFDRARFFNRANATPLPEWAAEFDAKTWAQFCLKYVLSHPAVVVARTGTTQAAHMVENIGGGIGRLPNEAMRKRMAEFVDALPPTPPPGPPKQQPAPQSAQKPPVVVAAALLDRYVGEYKYALTGQTVRFRRDGEKLLMKVSGPTPEVPVAARSETRFEGPFEMFFEFEVDGRGTVTRATAGQGPNRMVLEPIAPVAVPTAVLDRYVGEYKSASGFAVSFRRDGTSLLVKPGTNPESALIPRSEMRFEDPRGPAFEFQVDAAGKVTSAVLQQGAGQPVTLVRQ